jgi:hypothetical protein
LRTGDLLLVNDTKVIPARLVGRRMPLDVPRVPPFGKGMNSCLFIR